MERAAVLQKVPSKGKHNAKKLNWYVDQDIKKNDFDKIN